MSLNLTVGDLTIHRIIEQETTFLPALDMLPGLTPELLAENSPWMQKAGAIDAERRADPVFPVLHREDAASHHPGRQLHRQRQAAAAAPEMEHEDRRHLYARAGGGGVSVDDIDFVMCTHLHVDHVGWNTRLEDGRWVPTFPNARYVFAKTEFDYWTEQHAKTPVPPFGDSVLPIVEAKQAEIVRDDYRDRRSCAHPADAGPYAGTRRVRLRPRQGQRRRQRRPDALAAAGALSRTVSRNSTSTRRRPR